MTATTAKPRRATSAISAAVAQITAPAIGQPWPGIQGSAYVGISSDKNGQPYALVLLADKPEKDVNWTQAVDWAKRVGGELPNRVDGALMFANIPELFERRLHWLSEQYSSCTAWHQYFFDGSQDYELKKFEARARAVRRFSTSILQSFEGDNAPAPTNTEMLQQILDQIKGSRADIEKIFLADIGAAS